MANYWIECGRVANVMTFDQQGVRPYYLLRPKVMIEFLDLRRDSHGMADRIVNNFERICAM